MRLLKVLAVLFAICSCGFTVAVSIDDLYLLTTSKTTKKVDSCGCDRCVCKPCRCALPSPEK